MNYICYENFCSNFDTYNIHTNIENNGNFKKLKENTNLYVTGIVIYKKIKEGKRNISA